MLVPRHTVYRAAMPHPSSVAVTEEETVWSLPKRRRLGVTSSRSKEPISRLRRCSAGVTTKAEGVKPMQPANDSLLLIVLLICLLSSAEFQRPILLIIL